MRHTLALLSLVAVFAHSQDQRPAVQTATEGVLIDVTVLDKDGKPVTDLNTEDFGR